MKLNMISRGNMGMRLSITMNMNTEKEMINQEITSKISTSMASKAQHKKNTNIK